MSNRFNSPEVIEKAAIAIAKADGFCWEDVIGDAKIPYRAMAQAAITAILEQTRMGEGEALDAAHHHFHYGDLNILGANVRGYLQALRDLDLITDDITVKE